MVRDCRNPGARARDTAILAGGLLAGWHLLARLRTLAPLDASPPSPSSPPGRLGDTPVDPCDTPADLGRVSVVIPARNEERNLPQLLAALARQNPPVGQIIVVDDRSTDATAAVAEASGVILVAGAEAPPGWSGKCWACHQGAGVARGERLVFLDADVTLAPDAIARLAAEHDTAGGLLSVAPYHRVERPHEQLSAVANAVALMGTGAFSSLARAGQASMAFGPCLIVRTEDYRSVGGHAGAHVRGAVAEDVALAGRFRAAGLAVNVLAGGDAVAYRMYPDGLRQLYAGWTRVLADGARRTPAARSAAIGLWVAAGLLAGTGPLRSLATGSRPASRDRRTRLIWYGAFSLEAWWAFRRIGNFGAAAVAYPISLSTFVFLFTVSALRRLLGRPPTWRGRRMPAAGRL